MLGKSKEARTNEGFNWSSMPKGRDKRQRKERVGLSSMKQDQMSAALLLVTPFY